MRRGYKGRIKNVTDREVRIELERPGPHSHSAAISDLIGARRLPVVCPALTYAPLGRAILAHAAQGNHYLVLGSLVACRCAGGTRDASRM